MIVLPFGSGVVAAFIFLVFELLVFPLLFYSTSKLASLFLYWSARKGNLVLVEGMRFPLWNDGLTSRQRSNVAILAIRIALLAIPVYLETTLVPRDRPVMVSRTLENAFVPEPVDDWFSYQNRSGTNIADLRLIGLKCFFSCAFMDEEGWVWAKVANVTLAQNDLLRVRCVDETAKPVYRLVEELVGFEDESARQYLAVNISWTEGRVGDFEQALVADTTPDADHAGVNESAYRIQSVQSLNDTAMECFVADSVKTFFTSGSNGMDGAEWRGWCQKKEDSNIVSFFLLYLNMAQLPMRSGPFEANSEEGQCQSSCKFVTRHASTVVLIAHRGSFEFMNEIVLGAKHLANFEPNYDRSNTASGIAEVVLYSMVDSVSISLRSGTVRSTTEVQTKVMAVGIIEVVFVLLGALVLNYGLKWKGGNVQQPNTMNGLSRCWAQAEGKGEWISLSLKTSGAEEGHLAQFRK